MEKRGRGRPRKNEQVKRGRGRSKKEIPLECKRCKYYKNNSSEVVIGIQEKSISDLKQLVFSFVHELNSVKPNPTPEKVALPLEPDYKISPFIGDMSVDVENKPCVEGSKSQNVQVTNDEQSKLISVLNEVRGTNA